MKSSVTEIFTHALEKTFPEAAYLPPLFLERPKNREHGDYALNIAMTLASKLKKNPREIAEAIIANIGERSDIFRKIDIAGPGFINITLADDHWRDALNDIHKKKERYGCGSIGCGKKINIEFVSANPTGPLHVGHGRGAAVGDALARILVAAGYDVTREYYINDAGSQINNLGASINYRIRELSDPSFAGDAVFPEDGYRGGYIKELASSFLNDPKKAALIDSVKALSAQEISSGPAAVKTGEEGADALLKSIAKTLSGFGGVHFDAWSSERKLHKEGKVAEAIGELSGKGLLYEKDGATWFRSSDFGDEKDRVIKKDDGNLTYLAADIAYHKQKLEKGYDKIIDVWGADHHGYIKRVRGAIEAIGFRPEKFHVLLIQMVSLMRGTRPVPMSKRSGEFVTLQEVIDEVGSDAARFFFLMRRYDSQLEFDLELAKKTTADNPVFYVQYMHARICSILRHAGEEGLSVPGADKVRLDLLTGPEEMEIIKFLASLTDTVEGSAAAMEPHRIAVFLQNLAIAFHSYYNKTRVVTGDRKLSEARLYMVSAAKIVVRNALTLLGVSSPERM